MNLYEIFIRDFKKKVEKIKVMDHFSNALLYSPIFSWQFIVKIQ